MARWKENQKLSYLLDRILTSNFNRWNLVVEKLSCKEWKCTFLNPSSPLSISNPFLSIAGQAAEPLLCKFVDGGPKKNKHQGTKGGFIGGRVWRDDGTTAHAMINFDTSNGWDMIIILYHYCYYYSDYYIVLMGEWNLKRLELLSSFYS